MDRTARIATFCGIAYGLAIVVALGFRALGGSWTGQWVALPGVMLMFTPLAAAVLTNRLAGRRAWQDLGVRPRLSRWLLIAALVPLVMAVVTTGVSLLMPDVHYTPDLSGLVARYADRLSPEQLGQIEQTLDGLPIHPYWLSLPQVLMAGMTVNALAAFGEEVGWRGFLQRELAHLGFWPSSLLVGIIWGGWHAPVILQGYNYPDHPLAGAALFLVVCALLSPLHSWVRSKGGTVWAAAVFHGTFNAAAGLPLLVIAGGSDLSIGVQGLAGILVLALANLGLLALVGRGSDLDLRQEGHHDATLEQP